MQKSTHEKNMLLLKNPQFLPNHYETLSKWGTHEYLIWTKFRNDWVKIVDFLIKAKFLMCTFLHHNLDCRISSIRKTLFLKSNIIFPFQSYITKLMLNFYITCKCFASHSFSRDRNGPSHLVPIIEILALFKKCTLFQYF